MPERRKHGDLMHEFCLSINLAPSEAPAIAVFARSGLLRLSPEP